MRTSGPPAGPVVQPTGRHRQQTRESTAGTPVTIADPLPGRGREGDYTAMAGYYDLIMQAGYYDYAAIGHQLARFAQAHRMLEIGTGTGLILEQLILHRPELELTGIDLTPAMLDIAAARLRPYPRVAVHQCDVVTLALGQVFDLAFSYGGPHYFVPSTGAGPRAFTMISHVLSEQSNRLAFARVADHLEPGALLLLGVQPPHTDYTTTIGGQMRYAQQITPTDHGFRKVYSVSDHGETVMEQTTDYRTSTFAEAMDLLGSSGFEYQPDPDEATSLFLTFVRR